MCFKARVTDRHRAYLELLRVTKSEFQEDTFVFLIYRRKRVISKPVPYERSFQFLNPVRSSKLEVSNYSFAFSKRVRFDT